MTTRRVLPAVAIAAVAAAALVSASCSSGTRAPTALVGTFRISAGRCHGKDRPPSGSYLVVAAASSGQDVANPEGGCDNPAYTPLAPGTDGGVVTGTFQPNPVPTFGPDRNSHAARIVAPVSFQGFKLGMATTAADAQHGPGGPATMTAPSATIDGHGHLHLDLRSLDISYGGAPASTCAQSLAGGCWDLGSGAVTGTYDAATGAFTAEWFVGESFTPLGDSLRVYLEGTFVPSGGRS